MRGKIFGDPYRRYSKISGTISILEQADRILGVSIEIPQCEGKATYTGRRQTKHCTRQRIPSRNYTIYVQTHSAKTPIRHREQENPAWDPMPKKGQTQWNQSSGELPDRL